jgi:hypothetical protein
VYYGGLLLTELLTHVFVRCYHVCTSCYNCQTVTVISPFIFSKICHLKTEEYLTYELYSTEDCVRKDSSVFVTVIGFNIWDKTRFKPGASVIQVRRITACQFPRLGLLKCRIIMGADRYTWAKGTSNWKKGQYYMSQWNSCLLSTQISCLCWEETLNGTNGKAVKYNQS